MDEAVIREVARQYGTPSYMFDMDIFAERIRHVKRLLGKRAEVCYAMKANPFFTEQAVAAGDSLEVCSYGEYEICRRLGIEPDRLVISGVNKERSELLAVMGGWGAGTYTAESLNQLELLESCAKAEGKKDIPVLLRLSSGNQFGMEEETILAAVAQRDQYPHLELAGLQYYSGTQKKKMDKIRKELMYLDEFCTFLKETQGFEVRQLEYGPGFGVTYFQGEEAVEEDRLLEELCGELDSLLFRGKLVLEMGRFLAAPCGSYITKVVDQKTNRGQNYAIVDGGINHVNYYGQTMAMKIPHCTYLPPEHHTDDCSAGIPWMICGSLCTAGDILIKNFPVNNLQMDGLLVFEAMGAYSVTEGIYLFLSRNLPTVLAYSKSRGLSLMRAALPTYTLNMVHEREQNMQESSIESGFTTKRRLNDYE